MFYIENDNKILLFDENLETLQNTIAFMPQYEGLEIKEVQKGYVIYDFELMTVEEKETIETQKERERLDGLSMTRGDMFEAIILAFGKTKADIRSMIENVEGLTDIERALYLNRFDEALDFYRGYPAVDLIGQMLGISSEQLDKFFEFKDYKYLMPNEPVTEEVTEETDVIPEEKSIETDIIPEEVTKETDSITEEKSIE